MNAPKNNELPLTRRALLGGFLSLSVARDPLALQARAPGGSKRWAVLVGVAEYEPVWVNGESKPNPNNLPSPENDVPAVHDLLTGKYGFDPKNIRVLMSGQATGKAVYQAWDWLRDNAASGDQVFFYFSGHGTKVKRLPDDPEPGKFSSGLCVHDWTKNGPVPGFELGKRVDALRTANVVIVIEACHSSSGTRNPKARALSLEGESLPPFPTSGSPPAARDRQRERFLSSANIAQVAYADEMLPPGRKNRMMGAMTFFLLEELRADSENRLTYRQLCDRLCQKLRAKYPPPDFSGLRSEVLPDPLSVDPPVPSVSGPNIDTETFLQVPHIKIVRTATPTAVVESVNGDILTLRSIAGAVITANSVLETVATATTRTWQIVDTDEKPESAWVQVGTVSGNQSTGRILSGTPVTGQFLEERLRGVPPRELLAVYILGAQNTTLSTVGTLTGIRVTPKQSDADVVLIAETPDAVQVYRGSLRVCMLPASEVPTLLTRLVAIGPLLNLSNRISGLVLEVQGNKRTGILQGHIGSRVQYSIQVNRNGYISLVSLAADGKVTGAADIRVVANTPLEFETTLTKPQGLDIMKVIYSVSPLSVTIPSTGADFLARGGDAKAISDALLQNLRSAISASSERGQDFSKIAKTSGEVFSTNSITVDGWATSDFYLNVLS